MWKSSNSQGTGRARQEGLGEMSFLGPSMLCKSRQRLSVRAVA